MKDTVSKRDEMSVYSLRVSSCIRLGLTFERHKVSERDPVSACSLRRAPPYP